MKINVRLGATAIAAVAMMAGTAAVAQSSLLSGYSRKHVHYCNCGHSGYTNCKPPTSTGGTPPSSTGGTPPSSTGGTPPSSTGGTPPSSSGGSPNPVPEPAMFGLFSAAVLGLGVARFRTRRKDGGK